jgi:hypothetical protein
MAYVVSALGSYTEENAKELIYKQIASGDTAKYMTVQPGIKSAETINIVSTTAVWQAGGACGFTASGDTTYSQREITIGKVTINLKWCEADLEPKYLQKAMKAGSSYDMLTFEKEIIGDVVQNTARKVELAIWKGDTDSVDAYLKRFDGLIKIIDAASGVNTASAVAWSVANSRTALQNVYAALTDDMLANPNLKVFMGLAEARDYRMKLGIDNLYHITGAEGKLYLENTDVEIVPVLGLSGTKRIFALSTDNMFLGTDLANEEEKFELFYAKEADEIRYVSKFKLGVQVAFPDQIVKQTNT